jgi:hypothetical protein
VNSRKACHTEKPVRQKALVPDLKTGAHFRDRTRDRGGLVLRLLDAWGWVAPVWRIASMVWAKAIQCELRAHLIMAKLDDGKSSLIFPVYPI